jgi:hypothetical protein
VIDVLATPDKGPTIALAGGAIFPVVPQVTPYLTDSGVTVGGMFEAALLDNPANTGAVVAAIIPCLTLQRTGHVWRKRAG